MIIFGTIQTRTQGVDFPYFIQIPDNSTPYHRFGQHHHVASRLRHFSRHGYMYYYVMKTRLNLSNTNYFIRQLCRTSALNQPGNCSRRCRANAWTTECNAQETATEAAHSIFFSLRNLFDNAQNMESMSSRIRFHTAQ